MMARAGDRRSAQHLSPRGNAAREFPLSRGWAPRRRLIALRCAPARRHCPALAPGIVFLRGVYVGPRRAAGPVCSGPARHESLSVYPMSPKARPKIVAMIVGSAVIMQQLDSTVITTALPQMALSLHTDPVRLSVAVTAYILSLAVFIPVSGWAADRFGGRTVFRAAIALFTLGSILCGLSGNTVELTAARVLQGLGGSMMVPVGRLVLFRSIDKVAVDRDDGLSAGAGAARPRAGSADRRLHHHLFLLALDIPDQCAARHSRHRAGDDLFRQSQGRRPAAPDGLVGLRAHRRRRCPAS